MHWLYITLLAFVSIAVSAVSGRPSPTPTVISPAFRVATFNIHKGADRRGRYNLQRTAEAIAGLEANLVAVQEVVRHHEEFDCDDQPALLTEALRHLTGRPWTHAYAGARTAGGQACLPRSGEDATEGVAFFAPEPIVASKYIFVSEGRLGLMVRVASMPDVPVIVTHLAASNTNQARRMMEVATLLPWVERHGPGILVGDLNATPEAPELAPIMVRYQDAWSQAAGSGLTRGVDSGATWAGRRGRRIDYVFYSTAVDLTLVSADVVDTSRLPEGNEASDHRPLVATFRRVPLRLR